MANLRTLIDYIKATRRKQVKKDTTQIIVGHITLTHLTHPVLIVPWICPIVYDPALWKIHRNGLVITEAKHVYLPEKYL